MCKIYSKNRSFLFAVMLLMIIPGSFLSGRPTEIEKSSARGKARSIVRSVIRPYMTDFEKIMVLHEYITDRVKYGKLNGKTSAYTALLHHQADCVGFARSLNLLFRQAGLESFVVERRKGHLWVKVKIHGNYYNIDPTWCAVKSRWPQYSWFLLSDRQNVDSVKGVSHILDSGEVYPPAPLEFVFNKSDYINRRLLRSSVKLRIMGTINLPRGIRAPAGGIIGSVNGSRFMIPEGKTSAFFIALIKRSEKKYPVLTYSVKSAGLPGLVKTGYYGGRATVIGRQNALRFNTNSLDVSPVSLDIVKAEHYISGRISFPKGRKSPERGVYISMELTCYRGRERVRYYDRVYIPRGETMGQYHIDIPEEDKNREFYLYYYSSSLEKAGYAKVGYYRDSKTVTDSREKTYLKLERKYKENVDLNIIKP